MNSLEVFAAVRLLGGKIAGAKVEKIFQTTDGRFAFELFSSALGKKFLMVMKDFAYLTDRKPPAPDVPPDFCMLLRKRLCGSVIAGVSQAGFDRILSLKFSSGLTLACEVFDGNMILLDENGTIMAALRKKRWRTRAIFPGEKYLPPPGPVDPRLAGLPMEKVGSREIVKLLAAEFGLGGFLAEEVCFRAGIGKSRRELGADEVARLSGAISQLFEEAKSPKGFSYSSGTVSSPVRLGSLGGEKEHPTYFEALEAVSAKLAESEEERLSESETSRLIGKQEEMIGRQRELVEKYEKEAERSKRAGDLLMLNLAKADSITAKVRKVGWTLAARVPGVKGADKKSGKITLDIWKPS